MTFYNNFSFTVVTARYACSCLKLDTSVCTFHLESQVRTVYVAENFLRISNDVLSCWLIQSAAKNFQSRLVEQDIKRSFFMLSCSSLS